VLDSALGGLAYCSLRTLRYHLDCIGQAYDYEHTYVLRDDERNIQALWTASYAAS
jgi:hypothetical protein